MNEHEKHPLNQQGYVTIIAFLLVVGLAGSAIAQGPKILFFGDSLTSGYGTSRRTAFPAVIQSTIDSLGLQATIVNAGLSGETSAAGVRRIDWVLGAHKAVDIFVLELGGNDGLRGVSLATTEKNLLAILDRVKVKHPTAALVVAGVLIPPNLGTDYTETFAGIFPRVAASRGAVLIPFLLEGVAAVPELNVDDIHPNQAGHRLVAATVWPYLEPLVRARQRSVGTAQDLEGRRSMDAAAAESTDDDGGERDDGDDDH